MKITTKTGDKGETGLFGGERVLKSALVIEVIGELDELTSFLGWAGRGVVESDVEEGKGKGKGEKAPVGAEGKGEKVPAGAGGEGYKATVRLQDDIYRIMGFLGMNFKWASYIKPLSEEDVVFLEDEIERIKLIVDPENKNFKFIRPGTCEAAARLHICRSVCRRVERRMVELNHEKKGIIPGEILKYLNRLSDLLFVMAYSFEEEIAKY